MFCCIAHLVRCCSDKCMVLFSLCNDLELCFQLYYKYHELNEVILFTHYFDNCISRYHDKSIQKPRS